MKQTAMWHYLHDNQAIGPIDIGEVKVLITRGRITRSTKVWCKGMADWQPVTNTELWSLFAEDVPPPVSPPFGSPPPLPSLLPAAQASSATDVKRLETWFLVSWICLGAGLALFIAGTVVLQLGEGSAAAILGILIYLVAAGGYIAGGMFFCFMVHKLWSLIPSNVAKITPGKAVGFLFIPCFNCYWTFVALHGLAQTLNAETKRRLLAGKDINESISLTFCVLIVCSVVLSVAGTENPLLILAVNVGLGVIGFLSLKQMKDAGIALIQSQNP
jgi:hypothetical protein